MHKLLESLKEVKSLYDDEFDLEKNGLSVFVSNCIVVLESRHRVHNVLVHVALFLPF